MPTHHHGGTRPRHSPITGEGGLTGTRKSGRMSRSGPLANLGRSRSTGHMTTVKPYKNKQGDWVCPCCNPAYNAGMSKQKFLASGDRYVAPKTNGAFFSRGSGYFKAGAVKAQRARCGAVHTSESTEKVRRSKSEKAFKPSYKNDLFSKPSLLGPNGEESLRKRGAGGGFKAGKYQRKAEPAPVQVYEEFEAGDHRKAPEREALAPFKAGQKPGDFFDKSYYMRGEEADVAVRRQAEGKWYGAGRGGRAFNRHPKHMPDPYSEGHVAYTKDGMYWGKVNMMERAVRGPGMYICYCDPESRTSKLVDTSTGKVLKEWKMNETSAAAKAVSR